MKLETNMYVRLNCNYELGIGKIIRGIDEDNFIKAKFKDDFECSVPMYMISKASYNIIEILGIGDIISFYEDIDNYKKQYVIGIPDLITLDEIKDKITNDNIRLVSILTKEQFEQMAYKVGE